MVTATGQLTASSILLLPAAAFFDRPLTMTLPAIAPIAAMLAMAVLTTALAYILYFRLLASAGATNITLVTFLVPVSAILLGVLFLAETLTGNQIAGMLLIGLGLVAIDGRLPRLIREKFTNPDRQ